MKPIHQIGINLCIILVSLNITACFPSSASSDPYAGMTYQQVYAKARAEADYPPMKPDPIGTVQSPQASSTSSGVGDAKVIQISPPTSQSRPPKSTSEWRKIIPGLAYRITRISANRDYDELIGQCVVSNPSHYMYRYSVEFKNDTLEKYDLKMDLMQPNPSNYNEIKVSLLYILQIDPMSSNFRSVGDYRGDL